MKIGLVSSATPLVDGGYRSIVTSLADKLTEAGHRVETIWIPVTDDPQSLLTQMMAFRLLDLDSSCDRVVTFRPPAYAVRHASKIVWFIHHHRVFYDLWDSEYRIVPDTAYWRAFRQCLTDADTNALREARTVFTNSATVGDRLRKFNGIESEVLYPPILAPERFKLTGYGDTIVCVCRCQPHKRQHLLVEAMRYCKTPVRLHLAGASASDDYLRSLHATIDQFHLQGQVTLDPRWISEEEKIHFLSTALANAYVPFDEDSYGYPTLEAAHARKATISTRDSGGVWEFITHGENGLMVEPEPRAIAEAFDALWHDRSLARTLGTAAHERVAQLGITWDHVLDRLLA
jgi:glycosyltransferase involved in cell wall biosynthesis